MTAPENERAKEKDDAARTVPDTLMPSWWQPLERAQQAREFIQGHAMAWPTDFLRLDHEKLKQPMAQFVPEVFQ